MAASYVTVAQLRSNLGIGTLYSDADLESICQTSEDLLNSYMPGLARTTVATLLLMLAPTTGALLNHK